MTAKPRLILLGAITGAHGIRGDVLVRTFTGDPAAIAGYGALTDADGRNPLQLAVVRVTDKGVVARVAGIADRNGAEALKGRQLYVPRSALPAADEGEYYHEDLIGLAAVDPALRRIGSIVAVQNFGAGDILEVKLDGAARTELVPFADPFVPKVDIAAGRCVIVLPVASSDDDDADRSANDER